MQTQNGAYQEVTARVRAAGLLQPRPWWYAAHGAMLLAGLAAVVTGLLVWRESWWLLLLAPALAVVSTQLGFLGHDIGHLQVTRNARHSRILGIVIGNLLGGLSYGWWVRKHNAHHAHPNDLERDPDVSVGAFVWDADQALVRTGTAAWLSRHQALLFFPMLLAEAINLHVSSVRSVLVPGLRHRSAEAICLVAHFVLYGALLVTALTWQQALAFLAIHKGLQGLYLGSAFAPNHKGMPTLGEEQSADPFLRQVLTSRNVRGGAFTDFALGALNYQIEHHLFPSMPRANLRLAQPIVRSVCADHRVQYVECSAFASYAAALSHLHRVGSGLRSSPSKLTR